MNLYDFSSAERNQLLLESIQSRCREDADCWIWLGTAHRGVTPKMVFNGDPAGVRRLAYLAARGRVRNGYEVICNCGTKLCCNPEHLTTVSRAERRRRMPHPQVASAAMVAANRLRQGKLTMEKAREIRASDEPHPVLAERYGVTPQLISLVRLHKAWKEPSPFAGLGARS
ncbi:HNH endonuclease [uncultured Pseudacidovorax sp.]|uniref:HNH endonuclease n=1 Tax=uncultured Pseudacidovorax sp. TaxID=679313 RepID=UPI0025F898DD|nr:HNH endonuclease [uncultured Pseudacidovorax sp.]